MEETVRNATRLPLVADSSLRTSARLPMETQPDGELSERTNAGFLYSYQYLLLALFTLVATTLRFYKLGEWSFWGDELYTIRDALGTLTAPGLHPVSFVLTGLVLNSFGVSEWSARLVSALIGIVTIPILYFPIRKIFGIPVALAASILLTISPWHLYWSQNARFYTAMLLFYSIALFLFYFAIEEDRPLLVVLSLVFVGLAFQERLTALLFIPVVCVYLLGLYILPRFGIAVGRPKGLRMRNLAIFFVPSLLAGSYFVYPHLLNWSDWLLSFGRINNSPLWLSAGFVFYVRIIVICFGLAGMGYLFLQANHRYRRPALLLGSSALVPLLAIIFVSMVQYTANRYVFVSLTSWLVLASVAVVALWRTTQTPVSSWASKLLVLAMVSILIIDPIGENVLYFNFQNGNREDWRSALAFVEEHKAPNDAVILSHDSIGDFYLKEPPRDIYSLSLEEMQALNGRTWFVEDMNLIERWPEAHAWIVHSAQLRASFDVAVQARRFTMRVYYYEPGMPVVPVQIR